jgi:hypothetical protein
MIGPRYGGLSHVRWSDDGQENGVIDLSGLGNILRDRPRTSEQSASPTAALADTTCPATAASAPPRRIAAPSDPLS